MRAIILFQRTTGRQAQRAFWPLLLTLGAVLCAAPGGRAADDSKVAVATCASPAATVLRRAAPGKAWEVLKPEDKLYAGELLLGLPGAALDGQGGAVRLSMPGNLDDLSPFPIRESAVELHQNADVDLDVTLDRGRIDAVNRKEKGPATVRVRVRDQAWDMTLTEPGARVACELYGRWPRGTRFSRQPRPGGGPVAQLAVLVLHGDVDVKHGGFHYAMKAPPGPALLQWDSVTGGDDTPTRLEKLPAWAHETGDSPTGKLRKQAVAKFRGIATEQSLDAALDAFQNAADPRFRRMALVALAALDDLPRLAKAWVAARDPEVLDVGILAMRHWLGRGPGQDVKLYELMIGQGQLSPVEAETVLQLLFSFSAADLSRPETYEMLIDYLEHDRPAIRHLAHWHLERLVPSGRGIAYQALDPADKRAAAIQEWRRLVPRGQLPPKPRAEGK
jgi:hypothetical protein